MRLLIATAAAGVAALAFGANAWATEQTFVFQTGPLKLSPYGVFRDTRGIPSPQLDGYVVGMKAEVVDANGRAEPPTHVMLHHVVFAKVGVHDYTCRNFVGLDGRTIPAIAERFFAESEEHQELALPAGYGYPNRASDPWGLTVMLMNHGRQSRTVYVRYHVRYVTDEPRTSVRPVWLDVRNCQADPVWSVPGTGRRRSEYARHADFRMPQSGRIVAALGHLHGGGVRLELSDQTCARRLFTFLPTWGGPMPMPVMHEPGPSHISSFTSVSGIPVASGSVLRLNAVYGNDYPHTRVMGISLAYLAPGAASGCGAMPHDMVVDRGKPARPPHVVVPLLRKPRGPLVRARSASVVDFGFVAQRVLVRRGTFFRWRFLGGLQHDVTLANGPVGFASPSVSSGTFTHKFARRGVYRLYCSLHPARMTQIVIVR
jgi:hypothetical protein